MSATGLAERYDRARRLLSAIALVLFCGVILSFGAAVQGFTDLGASTTMAGAAAAAAVGVGSLVAFAFLLTLFLGMLHRFDLMGGKVTRRIPAFEGPDAEEAGRDG